MKSNSVAYSIANWRASHEFVGVADREPRLQAVEILVGGETRRGEAQLIRRRSVLGVVDEDEFAPGARKRNVERPRLGLRRARRRDDDLVAARAGSRLDEPAQGLGIALLDDQLDVEFALRVVEPRRARGSGRQRRALPDRARRRRCSREVRRRRARADERSRRCRDRRHRPQQDHGGESEPKPRRCNGLQRAQTRQSQAPRPAPQPRRQAAICSPVIPCRAVRLAGSRPRATSSNSSLRRARKRPAKRWGEVRAKDPERKRLD